MAEGEAFDRFPLNVDEAGGLPGVVGGNRFDVARRLGVFSVGRFLTELRET